MTLKRKSFDIRENVLQLAHHRIQRGRSKTGEKKVTIATVAREACVSTTLTHNYYPNIAEAIRDVQARSSRAQRDVKHHDLRVELKKNRALRQAAEELNVKFARLESLNEVLMNENQVMKAKLNHPKVVEHHS